MRTVQTEKKTLTFTAKVDPTKCKGVLLFLLLTILKPSPYPTSPLLGKTKVSLIADVKVSKKSCDYFKGSNYRSEKMSEKARE